jgi:hypothetical protein
MSEAARAQAERVLFHALEFAAMKRLLPNEGRVPPLIVQRWPQVIELTKSIVDLYSRSDREERKLVFKTLMNFSNWMKRNAEHLDFAGDR